MAAQANVTELEALRARVAALEARASARGRERMPRSRWLGVALVVLLALVPAALGASDRFRDVPDGVYYHDDATALADAGITRGCFDTAHFCPNDVVTRGQMASFLARTAGLGGNPPVTNALTLNGWAAHQLVRTTGAGSGEGGVVVVNTYQAVTAASINIPAPGFVYAVGAVNVFAGSGSSASYVSVRLRDVNSGLVNYTLNGYVGTSTGYTYESSFSPTAVFPAPAGTRTYALDVARSSTSFGATGATHGAITLIYIPFGGGGAQAASAGDVQLADVGSLLLPEAPPSEHPER